MCWRLANELKFETVLPGHGKPGGREYLDGQIRFLTELYAAVEKTVNASSVRVLSKRLLIISSSKNQGPTNAGSEPTAST